MQRVKLSVCIATFKRAAFIGATLETIVPQLRPDVELLILDGASPDNTSEVVKAYSDRFPTLRYIREPVNSGVDQDFDKAVQHARGEYCWLMTDDDLLVADAIETVLAELDAGHDLVVVNSEVRTVELQKTLTPALLQFATDRTYTPAEWSRVFADVGGYLSFIGGVVVHRELWLGRERAHYYGSLFIHIGVLFQKPLPRTIRVLARPLIMIRYGNAMWTARGFEIWMFKWPELVSSLHTVDEESRTKVCLAEPWRNPRVLFYWRAMGGYGTATFQRFLRGRLSGLAAVLAQAIAVFPASLANLITVAYLRWVKPDPVALYGALRSSPATRLSLGLAQLGGFEAH